jgi:hypothetical protein
MPITRTIPCSGFAGDISEVDEAIFGYVFKTHSLGYKQNIEAKVDNYSRIPGNNAATGFEVHGVD